MLLLALNLSGFVETSHSLVKALMKILSRISNFALNVFVLCFHEISGQYLFL